MERYFPFFLSTFDNFPEPIFRADAARYAYLFLFGGMYVDMDTECLPAGKARCVLGSDGCESDGRIRIASKRMDGILAASSVLALDVGKHYAFSTEWWLREQRNCR